MLLSCFIALLFTLPAVALLSCMRTLVLPRSLQNSRIAIPLIESLLWVAGVQVLSEFILLDRSFELLRAEATGSWEISGMGVLLRVALALPIFFLPHLLPKRPALGIICSLMWALLIGQPLLLQMASGVLIVPPLTSIGVEPVFVTPLTLTYFLIGSLWFLSVQDIGRATRGFSVIQDMFQLLQIPSNEVVSRWLSVFGLYAWLALGLILASAGSLSVHEVRISHYPKLAESPGF